MPLLNHSCSRTTVTANESSIVPSAVCLIIQPSTPFSPQGLSCCTGLFTDDFQSTLLPHAVILKEVARATLQLLFLCLKSVLQAYKTVELACMPRPPGDLTAYDSSLTQSQIAAKLAALDTHPGLAIKDEHAHLLDHRRFLGMWCGFCTLFPSLDHRGLFVMCPGV